MVKRVISAVLKFKDENFSSGLRKANQEAGEFGRYMQTAQNKVQSFNAVAGRAFKAVGVAAGALAVGGIAALGTAVASTVVEMETAYSKLSAQTGAIGSELNEYKSIANDVFKQGFGESLVEATTAVGKFANMFQDLDFGGLSDVTEGSFAIAKTFDQEATEVGRAVKAMLSNFDELSATDATDLLTVAFRETGDYANDLLDTVSEYSGYFKDVGMTGEQFTNTLIKGAQAGAWNIDKVGDAVKEFSILAIDGSKKTNEGFKAIGLNADDMASKIVQGGDTANQAYMATVAGLANMKDEVARNQAGVALFGTMWEDLRDDVVLAMSDSTNAVARYKGSTEQVVNALNSGPMARMKNAWRDLTVTLAEAASSGEAKTFLDGLATTAENLVPKVVDLADKAMSFANTIRDNWGPISNVIVGATVAITTFKVAMVGMTVVSTVAGFIQTFGAALKAGTVAQWAMNTAMAASPFTWVALGIAAVVAGAVLLWKNWDIVKTKASELWKKLQDNPFAALAAGPFGLIIGAAATLYKNFDNIKASFKSFRDAITNFKLPKWVSEVGGAISSGYKKVKGWVDGSHANGLNRVPYDGYTAELHKGEMVLPARQSNNIRSAGGNIDNIDKLITGSNSDKQNVTITSSPTKGGINFGDIIIQGMNKTTAQIVDEIIYLIKLKMANI